MGIVTGLSERITNSQSVSVGNEKFLSVFGQGHLGPVPALIVWTVVVVGGRAHRPGVHARRARAARHAART